MINFGLSSTKTKMKKLLQSKMRVGFMTYNSKIHFYNINGAKLSQPQQMTVGDVHDMFVPLADGLLTSLEESEAVIDLMVVFY